MLTSAKDAVADTQRLLVLHRGDPDNAELRAEYHDSCIVAYDKIEDLVDLHIDLGDWTFKNVRPLIGEVDANHIPGTVPTHDGWRDGLLADFDRWARE